MTPLDQYRAIVRRLIEEYASYGPASGDIRTEAVVDRGLLPEQRVVVRGALELHEKAEGQGE